MAAALLPTSPNGKDPRTPKPEPTISLETAEGRSEAQVHETPLSPITPKELLPTILKQTRPQNLDTPNPLHRTVLTEEQVHR